MSKDQLLRFTFEDLDIRGELVVLEGSWQEIAQRDDYPQAVKKPLAHALAAVALLSATIKYEGSLNLQIQGDGPFKTLVAQATHEGDLRGLARWQEEVPAASLQQMFGEAQMVITISTPNGKPHQSIVTLEGDQLPQVLEHYFQHSEQLASRFWMFVSDEKVAGLFIQQLPSKKPTEENWDRISLLADTTTQEEILSLPPEELLHRLFHEEKVRMFDPEPLRFKCSCSTRKIESSLFSMGKQELQNILDQDGKIDVNCDFCNQHYEWLAEDIEKLFTVDIEPKKVH